MVRAEAQRFKPGPERQVGLLGVCPTVRVGNFLHLGGGLSRIVLMKVKDRVRLGLLGSHLPLR